jgi:murein L,D-transpeptidase YafK
MIRALRLIFGLAIAGLALWLLAAYYVQRHGPPQIQTSIEGKIDYILVEKSARKMTLLQNGEPVRTYTIALGFAPGGTKIREGDGKTPEGIYKIDRRNANSAFTLSLGINYPTPADITRARAGGYSPGGDIFIHGQPNRMPESLQAKGDWTAGCIALTNPEIREVWQVTPIGTTVEIRN